MKKILLLFTFATCLQNPVHSKKFDHHYDYQQVQIDFMKKELYDLKLRAKIQPKISAIQRMATEIQTKSDLNYYYDNPLIYKHDLKKMLNAISELVEFRWNLYEEYVIGNFIGTSFMTGACATGCAIFMGLALADNNNKYDYVLPSLLSGGLAFMFGALAQSNYNESNKAKLISAKLQFACDYFLDHLNIYVPFDKNIVLREYFNILIRTIKNDEIVLFMNCARKKVIDDIYKDQHEAIQ